ncbi:MAG: exodeoxyribonuclease VII large subunit [Deltaproteobacteria bacterium]|nr:exodeoxyribonuclease VII large subunit [Deltaproteobacteria bacterium]MBW2284180.1 exodeoxyribonuclease VII large subunit [Deltaproteobacteria bacterium]
MDGHTPKVYSISELTREIQDLLESRFDFVWVEGEISNFSAPGSGHRYMVIKDEKAQIRAVMFRTQVRYLKFLPENGMRVIAQGRIGIYAPRGEYQLVLDYLEPMGVGALALAFEQLKKKLAAQGLFAGDIKKPLPYLPRRVAVITSPTGAAIRDFLKVAGRRFANLEIIIVPVRVQGEGAAAEMVKALELVNAHTDADVVVLTRGGGSLEDLWAFNEEELAHAIRRSKIPVVSAVGHEIDVTISDLAADLRAPTPSAAAELLVKEKDALSDRLTMLGERLTALTRQNLKTMARDLERLSRSLKDPGKRLEQNWQRLDELHSRLTRRTALDLRLRRERLLSEWRGLKRRSPLAGVALMGQQLGFQQTSLHRSMAQRLAGAKRSLSLTEKRLHDLSPLSILGRGYSITFKLPEETVLRDAGGTQQGERVRVMLARGELDCTVDRTS